MLYENSAVRRTNRVFGTILHTNQEIPPAASNVLAGRMRPAGRRLPTPGLVHRKRCRHQDGADSHVDRRLHHVCTGAFGCCCSMRPGRTRGWTGEGTGWTVVRLLLGCGAGRLAVRQNWQAAQDQTQDRLHSPIMFTSNYVYVLLENLYYLVGMPEWRQFQIVIQLVSRLKHEPQQPNLQQKFRSLIR